MHTPTPSDADARLTDLEIKLSFTEDVVERLDAIVVKQQAQIDLLMREVASLRREQAGADAQAGLVRNPRDELPPHY